MKLYDKLCNEAKWAIIEALKNNDVHNIDDMHNDIFNMDYYDDINPNNDADRAIALERFGSKEEVFEGIGRVYTYEMDNFGVVYTKLGNPASVLNMLYYIAGEEVLYSTDLYEYDGEITDELAMKLIDEYEDTNF
jgi:hypothetical protein